MAEAHNLIPDDIRVLLLENGRQNKEREGGIDFQPVVKLFTPDAGCTWLLTELDPDDPDIAFGLCDLGQGYPEMGTVSIEEIKSVRGKLRLPVERDLHFKPKHTLSHYARIARAEGIIKDT